MSEVCARRGRDADDAIVQRRERFSAAPHREDIDIHSRREVMRAIIQRILSELLRKRLRRARDAVGACHAELEQLRSLLPARRSSFAVRIAGAQPHKCIRRVLVQDAVALSSPMRLVVLGLDQPSVNADANHAIEHATPR